jgi:hypothetical protein
MLLSENHDVLSHSLVWLPWTTLSFFRGNAEVPNPLDECTSCTSLPDTQPEVLKMQTSEFSETIPADPLTAGASYLRDEIRRYNDTAENVTVNCN